MGAAKFSPKKYGLIHMSEGPTDVPLQLRNIRIEAKTATKYLGVWLDTHFTGIEHVRQLHEKATELIPAISSIVGSTWDKYSPQHVHGSLVPSYCFYLLSLVYMRRLRLQMGGKRGQTDTRINSIPGTISDCRSVQDYQQSGP
jgi:hypothetical protein